MVPSPGRVFCAVDTTELDAARRLAVAVSAAGCGVKLGLEFFVAQGAAGIRAVMEATEAPLFLDLKLHDIPNTVAGAVRAALPLAPAFLTIHASGGPSMVRAAADAAAATGPGRPRILAVTVLTSLDAGDLQAVGQDTAVETQVLRLARMAQAAGADGIVCSPAEVAMLREACGPGFTLMVPGIRPAGSDKGDQKRVMTPAEALSAGADHLVIGRPITAAPDPAGAARRILAEIGAEIGERRA